MRIDGVLWALLGTCLVTSAFVDLRLVHGELDVPVADVAAMTLAAVWGLYSVAKRGPLSAFQWPGLPWWPLFLAACLGSWWAAGGEPGMLYGVVRKPLFCWLVYGVGVAGAVRHLDDDDRLHALSLVHVTVLAGTMLPAALWLLMRGHAASYLEVPGLINNHKVLAVALAPWLPALWLWRRRAPERMIAFADVALVVGLLAVAASVSRTAWITVACGALCLVPIGGRPILARPWLAGGLILVAIGAMIVLPFALGTGAMEDAVDSRMSLNVRAWRMFSSAPVLGWGPGSSTQWLMNDPRHWRIDGIDAHGVVQKIAAEGGLVGLAAYVGALGWFIVRFWRETSTSHEWTRGAALLGLGLHLNLLLSTDTFSSAHWAPLAVALGVVTRAAASRPSGSPA